MTQIPQPSESPQMIGQDQQAQPPAPSFEPCLPGDEPPRRSRLPLVLGAASVVVLIGGLLFWKSRPNTAEAENTVVDVSQMTVEQLAEDAGPLAARELIRRSLYGTPAESAAASSAMNSPRSPRLARNLAVAMALEQQKRANEMRIRTEREMRRIEEGY